jgi:hypothetical protein
LRLVGPLLLLVTALWIADALLSRDRTVGWERNTVRNALNRVHTAKDARVAILGSSTSADWLPNAFAAQTLGRKAGEVVDAHLNGCHQPCTWSEVQGLLAQGRRYEVAFFGTNLFQQCEFVSPKRQLQDEMLLPTASIPAAFALYAHAEDPLGYVARFLGVKLSGVYGDTGFLQDTWRKATLGAASPTDAWRWARTTPPPPGGTHDCSYDDDAIAYKTAVTSALLDDLRALADVTYLMLLPDDLLTTGTPAQLAAWAKHRALHTALAEARPWVRLVDLSTSLPGLPGARRREDFRDGVHVSPAGLKAQQALFTARMKALGAKP